MRDFPTAPLPLEFVLSRPSRSELTLIDLKLSFTMSLLLLLLSLYHYHCYCITITYYLITTAAVAFTTTINTATKRVTKNYYTTTQQRRQLLLPLLLLLLLLLFLLLLLPRLLLLLLTLLDLLAHAHVWRSAEPYLYTELSGLRQKTPLAVVDAADHYHHLVLHQEPLRPVDYGADQRRHRLAILLELHVLADRHVVETVWAVHFNHDRGDGGVLSRQYEVDS